MVRVLVIDGQGGGMGASLVRAVKERCPAAEITAVGTNTAATAAMKLSGADKAATGENAVLACARRADVIAGPVACVIADALCGEITPAMARAVGGADAVRVLVPWGRCENIIVGVADVPSAELIRLAAEAVARAANEKGSC